MICVLIAKLRHVRRGFAYWPRDKLMDDGQGSGTPRREKPLVLNIDVAVVLASLEL